jgi:hypothetical protein
MITQASVTLPTASDGWFAYRYYVLSDGALAILWTDRDIHAEYQAWSKQAQRGVFPRKMRGLWNGNARLSTINDRGESALLSVPLVPHPEVDRFPDGRWLVASRRARANDANGLILDADGKTCGSFPIGDGIEHVRCASDGTIWVGYFDEGIFGDSVGGGGIVRFDAEGLPLWKYNEGRSGDSFIDDCYALTLKGDELWSCFYSDFPIVRVKDGKVSSWPNSVTGAKALAADGSFVLLAGGYGADANRMALLELDQGEARMVGSVERNELGSAALVQGRSSSIHVVSNGIWTQSTVGEARAHLG